MSDPAQDYERIRAKIGEIPYDPEIDYALCIIRDGKRPTEDVLTDLVKALHARVQLAEDTLLIELSLTDDDP